MTDYLLLNTLLSALIGAILWSLRDAPPRCRLWTCLMALGCWLVPWPLIDLSFLMPQPVSAPALIWWEATEAVTKPSGHSTAGSWLKPLVLFILAGGLGLLVFSLRLVGQAMHLKNLAYHASSGDSVWVKAGGPRVPEVCVRIIPGMRNAFIRIQKTDHLARASTERKLRFSWGAAPRVHAHSAKRQLLSSPNRGHSSFLLVEPDRYRLLHACKREH